jgi:hypothetical protein
MLVRSTLTGSSGKRSKQRARARARARRALKSHLKSQSYQFSMGLKGHLEVLEVVVLVVVVLRGLEVLQHQHLEASLCSSSMQLLKASCSLWHLAAFGISQPQAS